ncbi:MAG TPA: PAS domain-containing protein [Patescibacteria group bacterium]|nr:PAS domain-containing protein [Patescibacteria group bacterium]
MDETTIQFHRTLTRQILKIFGSLEAVPKEVMPLLQSVSDTYKHFDDDRALSDRSMELSSRELSEYISQLKATFEANSDGVLVVDGKGKIFSYNERFIEMWHMPREPIASHDDDKALAFAIGELIHPDVFMAKVKELYSQPEAVSKEVLEFKDGRIFERNSVPLKVGDNIIGRVWNFHDVTENRKAAAALQQKIDELAEMNQLMTGRELRISELKQEMKALKEKYEPDVGNSS